MSRATRASISTAALESNLEAIRRRAPRSRVMAVLKANAYGHGLEAAARALAGADAFAVACVEEALRIRAAGLPNPVILLEGAFHPDDLRVAERERFELVVHTPEQIDYFDHYRGAPLTVWFKLDTGMNRLGFKPGQAEAAWRRLQAIDAVAKPLRFMTHLANADLRDAETTRAQCERFAAFIGAQPGERSLCNSAGTLAFPEAHADWVRPGLIMYGVSPFEDRTGPEEGMRPAMTVSTRLIAVKTAQRGERVGYGGHWTAARDTRYGIAAIGYGDGYPRHAGNGTPVLVNGRRAPLIGRVSMDMIAVNLEQQPEAKVGDPVVLWGEGLPVEEIARHAGTIPYELLCGVTQRVKFDIV